MLAAAIQLAGTPARARASNSLSNGDLSNVRFVWLSSLDAGHSNAHIRYAVRRLHRLSPKLALFGAFWDGYNAEAIRTQTGLASVAGTGEDALRVSKEKDTGIATTSDDKPSPHVGTVQRSAGSATTRQIPTCRQGTSRDVTR